MSTQIKITRTLQPESQTLRVQDYRYLPPIQESNTNTPEPGQTKGDTFSPALMMVNGILFSGALIIVLLKPGERGGVMAWIAIVSLICFALSFIIGAIQAINKSKPTGYDVRQGQSSRTWSLGITLLGMLILLFAAFIAVLG